MAYATLASLKGRAGRLAKAWTPTSQPNDADLERFLDDVAAEVDAVLGALGVSPVPVESDEARGALAGLNTDAALLIALDATWPGGRGGDEVNDLRNDLRTKVAAAMKAIDAGTYPALLLLLSGTSSSGANNFWSREPNYGLLGSMYRDLVLSPNMRPAVYRDSKF